LSKIISSMFPGIAGATPTLTDNGAVPDQVGLINAILSINPWPTAAYNAATNTSGFTATQSQVMAAQDTVLALTGTLTAGAALTLPTVSALLATLTPQQGVVGSTTLLRVLNESGGAFAWTVTTNTGWTLNGTMSVAQTTFRDFIITINGVGASAAATIQDIGGGSIV
jgi:hypothetical protein